MPSLSELIPGMRAPAEYLVRVAHYNRLGPVSINSVYRSYQSQEILYDRYRRGLSAYPVAPPGRSMHQHRRAFDMNVRQGGKSPEQHALGRFWVSMGGKWSEKDPIHFWY